MNAMVFRRENQTGPEVWVGMDRGELQFREIHDGRVDEWSLSMAATKEFVEAVNAMWSRSMAILGAELPDEVSE